MKLFSLFYVLILSLDFNLLYTLKTNELCLKSREACKEIYGRKSKFCDDVKCTHDFSVSCGGQYCATSAKSCNSYRELMRSFLIRSTIIPIINEDEKLKFYKFSSQIKKCEVKLNPVEANDFCVKKINCFIKKEFVYNMEIINLMESVVCPCENTHSFECGSRYCTKYKHSCAELAHVNGSLIKKCRNTDRIKYQKLFSF